MAGAVSSASIRPSFKNVTSERRKDIRFRPAASIVVLCLDTQTEMTLDNLGSGGFSAHASADTAVGTVMRFRFSTPDGGWATLLTAQTVHSRQDSDVRGPDGAFLLGFKFLNAESPRVAASINALIDRATAVISFS